MKKSKKAPKDKREILLITLSIALLAGCLAGAYLWHSQVKELKDNRNSNQQKIEHLEKQIEDLKDSSSENTVTPITEATDPSTPTDKDIVEINRFQVEKCAPALQRDGSITRSELEKNNSFYNGYVRVNFACREVAESGGPGHVSYMKRQSDGSWKELFGAQDIPACDTREKYGIPEKVFGKCI